MSSMMMKLREQARKKAELDDERRGVKRLPAMDLRPDDSVELGDPEVMSVTDNDGFQVKSSKYKKLRDALSSQKGSDADVLDPGKRETPEEKKKRKKMEMEEEQ